MRVAGRNKLPATSSNAGRSNGAGITNHREAEPSALNDTALKEPREVSQAGSTEPASGHSEANRPDLTFTLEQLANRATADGLNAAAALLKAIAEQLRLQR